MIFVALAVGMGQGSGQQIVVCVSHLKVGGFQYVVNLEKDGLKFIQPAFNCLV